MAISSVPLEMKFKICNNGLPSTVTPCILPQQIPVIPPSNTALDHRTTQYACEAPLEYPNMQSAMVME